MIKTIKVHLSVFISISLLLLESCASTSSWSYFKLAENKKTPAPGSLAVISGSNSEFDITMAELITVEFNNKTKYKAMNQEKITQIIPQYPAPIIDFNCAHTDKFTTPFISENTWNNINAIQSRVKTKYILLAWNENPGLVSSQYSSSIRSSVFARLIEYPQKDLIGHTFVVVNRGLGPVATDKDVEKGFSLLLKGISENIVKGITGSLDSKKK